MVALQRVRLAAGAVEREHQLAAQPLPQRVLVDERLELGDELAGAAQLEIGVDPFLERVEAKLLETADLVLRERLEGEVGERRSPPDRQRFAEEPGPLGGAGLARLAQSRSKRARSNWSGSTRST